MIKKFNNFNESHNEKLYQEISYDEYDKLVSNPDAWYENEKEVIRGLKDNREIDSIRIFPVFIGIYKTMHDVYFHYGRFSYGIDKCQDDWFVISITLNKTPFSDFYYKCDQFEGLVAFLRDKADIQMDLYNKIN